jgi:hypothetical protein
VRFGIDVRTNPAESRLINSHFDNIDGLFQFYSPNSGSLYGRFDEWSQLSRPV